MKARNLIDGLKITSDTARHIAEWERRKATQWKATPTQSPSFTVEQCDGFDLLVIHGPGPIKTRE